MNWLLTKAVIAHTILKSLFITLFFYNFVDFIHCWWCPFIYLSNKYAILCIFKVWHFVMLKSLLFFLILQWNALFVLCYILSIIRSLIHVIYSPSRNRLCMYVMQYTTGPHLPNDYSLYIKSLPILLYIPSQGTNK